MAGNIIDDSDHFTILINATKGADATATKVAQNAKATEIAQYVKIDYKEHQGVLISRQWNAEVF